MVKDLVDHYSTWKEGAIVISLLSNCLNLIGFVSTSWATPDREYDENFEGLGLWRYCSHVSDGAPSTCYNTVDLDLPGNPIKNTDYVC